MQCCVCKKSLLDLSKRVYTCETTNDDEIKLYWCKQCYENTDYEHKRIKLKSHNLEHPDGKQTEKGQETERYLDNLFEDYHNLDCEDVIGGGAVKTRFGYQTVAKDDFGLNDEEILLMDDRALN